jgi:hypothetical protein
MDREKLKDLRPEIYTLVNEGTTEIEHFQNAVLRPVIKFQHDLIMLLVNNHRHFKELTTNKGARAVFHLNVQQFIGKQTDIKNQLIGCIIGQFTADEFISYKEHSNEFNKRIIQMVVQRITDTLY